MMKVLESGVTVEACVRDLTNTMCGEKLQIFLIDKIMFEIFGIQGAPETLEK